MAIYERTSVSGTALSYLLYECVNSWGSQEGFLFGNVTQHITNHISDSRTDNARVDVVINITSMLPTQGIAIFYHPSGKIKEDVLNNLLINNVDKVVGWYSYRKNSFLKPTMREKIISKELQRYFEKHNRRYFLFCNITCKQTPSSSTHTYSYRFSKVCRNGEINTLADVTSNLGESVSGYKRVFKGDQSDPFNQAVTKACQDGAKGVAEAVRGALKDAAMLAVKQEESLREIATEVHQMALLLADHHKARISSIESALQAESRLREERDIIQPIVTALASPPLQEAEPFDFVTDIIRSNLRQHESTATSVTSSSSLLSSCPTLRDEVSEERDSKNSSPKVTGHKRIHSEGAVQTVNMMDKGKVTNTRGWEQLPTSKSNPNHSID